MIAFAYVLASPVGFAVGTGVAVGAGVGAPVPFTTVAVFLSALSLITEPTYAAAHADELFEIPEPSASRTISPSFSFSGTSFFDVPTGSANVTT